MDWVSLGVKRRKCCCFVGFRNFFEYVLGGLTFLEMGNIDFAQVL